jgi:NADH:ubiquinone oxidoreductase subunit 5 (subunit L)/multisubunit Na+/H+ antiporter MnhA subunit
VEPLALSLLALTLTGLLLWLIGPHRSRLFAWAAATPPALITAWQVTQLQAAAQGAVLTANYPWAPSLGLEISLRLDGLALLFGLIITGIGTCIAFYTAYYFAEDKGQGLFYLLLFAFMASMLGLVWADNLLMLFVFWEGTSITSYLLIAFKTTGKDAVEGARRALIVTTMGGLRCLPGWSCLDRPQAAFRSARFWRRRDSLTHRFTRRRCCCWRWGPLPNPPNSPFISGCRAPWPHRRRPAPICIQPRW